MLSPPHIVAVLFYTLLTEIMHHVAVINTYKLYYHKFSWQSVLAAPKQVSSFLVDSPDQQMRYLATGLERGKQHGFVALFRFLAK